ncbi:sulfotransferase [Phenylobacterium deserti]|uniref:Sulfotransferase n=1 Tax=Phenylobacterium deserti TaxID=1914756 RepID=A0A328AF88_9CAUL|nr:sulfotransferase [Phenylobacterium deserti]RAK51458.1 hypothetical protein DJ018_16105 [Phenylobacterium deserti]
MPDIVAIIGCARSGSTLLEGKLQQAADVTALGEVAHLWSRGFLRDELCGCGAAFSRCEFWMEVLARAFGKLHASDARRFDAAFRTAVGGVVHVEARVWRPHAVDPLFADLARALYRAAHQVGGGKTLLDSSKPAHFAASIAATGGARVRPLHLFRSPAPNIQSLRTAKPRPQARDAAHAMMPRSRTLAHAIAHWVFRNAQASNFLDQHKGRSLTIHFDAFRRDASAELPAIMARLGLPARRAGDSPTWHSVSGNPLRFQPNGLDVRAQDRTSDGLNAVERALVRVLTGRQQMRLEARAFRRASTDAAARHAA